MTEERTEEQRPQEPPASAAGDNGEGDAAGEIEAVRREAEENWNKYLRLAAELDNVRKRNAREVENARRYGAERLAQSLLPVRDSMEAALAAAGDQQNPLVEGQRATLRLLDEALTTAGVREISPQDQPFDPNKHEALSMIPSATAAAHTVVQVVQKGYELNDRLLRAAKVIVSAGPAAEA